MAIDNNGVTLTTVAQDICTAPAGGAKFTLIQIANVGADEVDITVQWTNAADSDAVTVLAKGAPLAVNDALAALAGGLMLKEGDKLQAFASANDAADATACWTKTS